MPVGLRRANPHALDTVPGLRRPARDNAPPHATHWRGARLAISTARMARLRAAFQRAFAARAHGAQRSAFARRPVAPPHSIQRPFACARASHVGHAPAWRAPRAHTSPHAPRFARAPSAAPPAPSRFARRVGCVGRAPCGRVCQASHARTCVAPAPCSWPPAASPSLARAHVCRRRARVCHSRVCACGPHARRRFARPESLRESGGLKPPHPAAFSFRWQRLNGEAPSGGVSEWIEPRIIFSARPVKTQAYQYIARMLSPPTRPRHMDRRQRPLDLRPARKRLRIVERA